MKNFTLILLVLLFSCNSKNGSNEFIEKQTEETLLEIESKKFRNYDLLMEFEKAYIVNPDKTRPFYKQAEKVHNKTFTVNEIIETEANCNRKSNLQKKWKI